MTINKALNISLTGLKANQAALNVVSHNVANMNTEGYVKQRANFAEVRTNTVDGSVSGQIASLSGVKISGITTSSADYLNNYFRTQNSIYEGLLADATTAGQLSDLLDSLKGSGLGDSLNEFFSAASALNENPTDYSLRVNFVEKAKTAANKFNAMYETVNGLKESKVGDGTSQESANASEAGTYISMLNSDFEALVQANKQLTAHPDDASLKTERDKLLADISSIANVNIKISSENTASVSIGNIDLVLNNEQVGKMSISADGSIKVIDSEGNETDITSQITEGKLGGTLNGLSSITDAMGSINNLADAFAQTMNNIQTYSSGDIKAAYYDRGNDVLVESVYDLFTTNDGSGTFTASNIAVNSTVYQNPDYVAAARVDTSEPDWNKSVGNGDNALEFYNAQYTKVPSLGYLTLTDYLTSLATKAALSAASKGDEAETQGNVVDGIRNQILAETGVNLDEELTNMIMYQQAYNASARVFAACVEVMDTLTGLAK